MARKRVVELVDDIDGTVFGDEGEKITFAVNGVEYEIDLKDEHASEFHRKIGYFIEHATRSLESTTSSRSAPMSVGATTRAQFSARLDPDLLQQVKIEVATRGTTLQEATAEAFRLWLSSKVTTRPRGVRPRALG
ncbi:Lsr2 dimerization domain-containing protein [Rhodococcus sp. MSC1_016]|uniref:Lsr2 dimerization domain-containing protein n=1 Tax=Rhodococcus sp. MSC1_016 TaxID=2909266 RepID=UPI00202F0526|nr:histone-like nucleoid-structuring protein Lsr2 [Rhodococcus sp. MSC1_016]